MVGAALTGAGHDVLQASDGREALELATRHAFDLVVTDVNMPNMDGISLVRELRGLPAYRFTPLLVLTTETDTKLKDAGREAGATGWLQKPFDPERLLATIAKVLK
jgi:two-component system chemotaxis response regulator CheY